MAAPLSFDFTTMDSTCRAAASPVTSALLLAIWLGLAQPASATSIYRCGNSFSQTPCPQAQVVELRDDRPRAADVQATREAAARDARLAEDLARARERRERLALRQGAAALSVKLPEAQAAGRLDGTTRAAGSTARRGAGTRSSGTRKPQEFVALVPGSGRKSTRD